eukprot:scaffold54964_cov30-Tisochrysis_lutea.AAC.9
MQLCTQQRGRVSKELGWPVRSKHALQKRQLKLRTCCNRHHLLVKASSLLSAASIPRRDVRVRVAEGDAVEILNAVPNLVHRRGDGIGRDTLWRIGYIPPKVARGGLRCTCSADGARARR